MQISPSECMQIHFLGTKKHLPCKHARYASWINGYYRCCQSTWFAFGTEGATRGPSKSLSRSQPATFMHIHYKEVYPFWGCILFPNNNSHLSCLHFLKTMCSIFLLPFHTVKNAMSQVFIGRIESYIYILLSRMRMPSKMNRHMHIKGNYVRSQIQDVTCPLWPRITGCVALKKEKACKIDDNYFLATR